VRGIGNRSRSQNGRCLNDPLSTEILTTEQSGLRKCSNVLRNENEWREVCAVMKLGYARLSTSEQDTGLDAARKQGRIGGRRPKLRPNQQEKIVAMVSAGTKTAADAARLFNVHPATVSRLLARAGAGTIGVKVR
jgi:hypothetical protein